MGAGRTFDNAVHAGYAGSKSCQECHAAEHEKWAQSHHGLAERDIDLSLDRAAFEPDSSFKHGSQTTDIKLPDGKPTVVADGFDNKREAYHLARVIGVSPLRQFLVPVPNDPNRLQTLEATYDPHKDEWFNVYGNEDRRNGEWGHWTGRGMNWNSMCAACHNTRLLKNYDPVADTYKTAMVELGVGCESCHGPMKEHVTWHRANPKAREDDAGPRRTEGPGLENAATATTRPTSRPVDPHYARPTPTQILHNCGTCHSRRSELTGDYVPGHSYFDHYLLAIPDQSDLWYPDGQVRDEDYEFTSFLSSKMHAAGVRCTDCHDVHSAKTILPGNQLCIRCHNGSYPNSPVISPLTHTNHEVNSEGSKCINCHMPQTTYMQRHRRHDHGFTIPDPLLTKQHGIPNACNRCHTDKDVDWAIAATDEWYGKRMERDTRKRAQWLAKARAGDSSAREPVLSILREDKQSFWRAVAAAMLGQWATEPSVTHALLAATSHEDPLLRENAVRSLSIVAQQHHAPTRDRLTQLLADESRGVRLRSAWVLRESVDPQSVAGNDLRHYLEINSDQPTGAMQHGEYLLSRQDTNGALHWFQRAVRWDPNSAPIRDALAFVYSTVGRPQDALAQMKFAVQIAPNEADYHYRLGLAHHEVGQPREALDALRKATQLDPRHARAWYNLGLALNATGDRDGAINALVRGEQASPNDPDIPYARATIMAQMGRREEAKQAAQKALSIRADYVQAAHLLQMLSR